MTITAKELDLIWKALAPRLYAVGEIDLGSHDQYWQILSDEAFDFEDAPAPAVGSLSDDWHSIRRLIVDPHSALYSDLATFASLLGAVAEHIIPSSDLES